MMDTLIPFIGKLHPLVVHLPIGILIMALVLALFSKRRSFQISPQAISLVLLFGALSAIAACVPGLILASSGSYDENTLSLHKWFGIATAFLSIKCWFIYTTQSEQYPIFRFWINNRLAVLLVTVALLSTAGHYGGSLTHGENYLSFSESADGREGGDNSIKFAIADPENAKVYQDIIQPILKQRCESCHGATKKKGDLALHTREAILAGGKKGKVLVSGKAADSELYRRLMLPEGNDDRMPPKGRPGLTEAQIQLIAWWINQGASFDGTVTQLKAGPEVISLIRQFSKNTQSAIESDTLKGVSPPNEKDVVALREKGLKVLPINPGSSFYQVNAINAPDFNDNDVALLAKLGPNILLLKLDRSRITDQSLPTLAKLGSLRQLSLRKTAVTDAGLVQLKDIPGLTSLNLSETGVTDQGIVTLSSFKKLKKLYLFQTKVTSAAIAPLGKKGVAVELENYQLEKLPSDTINY